MLATVVFAVAAGTASLRAAADLSNYANQITGVTTPALLWSNVRDTYPNSEVDRIASLSEVLETFTNGVSSSAGLDKHIVIYGLPPGVTTKVWFQHEHENESLFPSLTGSFALFPYTLATPGRPGEKDWAELFATVNSSAVRFLTNALETDDGTEILHLGLQDTWATVRRRMSDARVLVIQPNLLEGVFGDLSFTANLAAFFPAVALNSDEQVFVLVADTTAVSADALPKVLNAQGAIRREVRGPMLPGFNAAIPEGELPVGPAGQERRLDDDMTELARSEAAVAAAYNTHPAADLRRLQTAPPADEPEIRITPMQVQMIVVVAAIVACVWIAVTCTGAISSPRLYLEKPIAVNKEF